MKKKTMKFSTMYEKFNLGGLDTRHTPLYGRPQLSFV